MAVLETNVRAVEAIIEVALGKVTEGRQCMNVTVTFRLDQFHDGMEDSSGIVYSTGIYQSTAYSSSKFVTRARTRLYIRNPYTLSHYTVYSTTVQCTL